MHSPDGMLSSNPSIFSINISDQHFVVNSSRESIYEYKQHSVGMSGRAPRRGTQSVIRYRPQSSVPRGTKLVLHSTCQPVSQVCLQQIDQPYRHSSHSPEHLIGYGNPQQLALVFRITNTTTNPSWHISRYVVWNHRCFAFLIPLSSFLIPLSLFLSVLYLTNTHIALLRHGETPSRRPIRSLSVQYRCTTSIFRGTPYHQRFRRWRVGDTKMSIPESNKTRCGK